MSKKRILELTNFSAGGCGVFARVRVEAELLSKKGYEVKIFTSNREKGTNKIVGAEDRAGNVPITRFKAVKLGGESFMLWNFEKEALKFKPDVIFAHSYRHPHTFKALKIAKKLGCKVILVTHAPFARGNTRTGLQKIAVSVYDKIFGKKYLNKFDKVITISHWEEPHLEKIGLDKNKIEYIPNGVPKEFLEVKTKVKEENKILFFGRVSRIKKIETIIQALPLLRDKNIVFEIVGPREEEYYNELKKEISDLGIQNRVIFSDAIYDIKKKIEKIDSARFCTLPSLSEGMPQSLIEYMARKKIVFASNNPGNSDLITHNKTGFLFEIGNSRDFVDKFNESLGISQKDKEAIKQNAFRSVKDFAWNKIINKIVRLIDSKV